MKLSVLALIVLFPAVALCQPSYAKPGSNEIEKNAPNLADKGTTGTVPIPRLRSAASVNRDSPLLALQKDTTNPAKMWTRDPFKPPARAKKVKPGRKKLPALKVSAILYSEKRSVAIINGKKVRVGDRIGGRRVLDIKRSYVILGKGKKVYRLELKK